MKEIEFDLVIVGNGPTAIHFIDEFLSLKKNKKLKIAHINSDKNRDLNIDRLPNIDLYLNQSSYTWKYLDSSSHLNNKEDIFYNFNSLFIGGLSRYWGAGISELNEKDLGVNLNLQNFYIKLQKYINVFNVINNPLDKKLFRTNTIKSDKQYSLKNPFNSIGTKITFGFAKKALYTKNNKKLDVKACNLCGGCNTYCFNNSIYNSANHFNPVESNDLKVFYNSTLESFEKNDEIYKLNIIQDNKKKEIFAKKLILACGTVNTSKLILNYLHNSNIKIKSTPLLHNPVIRSVFLSFKIKPHDQPAGINIAFSDDNELYTTIMFGSDISTSDLLSFLPLKNNFIKILINKIKKFIVVTLTFFPSELSSTYIQFNGKNFTFKNSSKYNFLHFMYRMKSTFFQFIINFMFPIFVQKLKDGSDLHHGGSFPIGSSSNINTNSNCELINHSGLFVIDGSWLPRISSKPHTYSLMANSRRVANIIFNKIIL